MKFELTKEENTRAKKWISEQEAKLVEMQKASVAEDDSFYKWYNLCWKDGHPYTGAAEGGVTYSFTPTSIGLCIVVKYSATGEELDLTDYDNW